MRIRGLMLALALSGAMLPFSGAHAWLSRDIRDWSVSCSNGLTCTMSFYDWDAKGLQQLHIRRAGAPNAEVELLLPAPEGFESKGDSAAVFAVAVDGKDVFEVAAGSLQPDRPHLVYRDQQKILALLDAMKAGTRMEVRYHGALGDFSLPVKLAGVKGSLLFLDEAQDRLKRTDALEAKGEKLPPEKTNLKDVTSFEELPEIVRKDFGEDGGACSDLETSSIGLYGGFDVELDGTRIIAVPCGTGGAYNQPYAIYLGYDVIIERVSFPEMHEGLPSIRSTAYNLDFDPKGRVITSFFKGRGIGDCGVWYKWKLSQNGTALSLIEARRKDDCDENNMGGAQNFPLTFPVKK